MTFLDVGKNSLWNLPNELFTLSGLKILKCSGNRLGSFPEIQKFPILEVPIGIYVLLTPQVLDVSKNSIRNLPNPLEHATLRVLKLAKSGITGFLFIGLFTDAPELPKQMNLPALEELDLSRLYKLHKVPGTLFEGLGNLVKLRIKNNGIKSIPCEITILR